jgi:hypothetical protein
VKVGEHLLSLLQELEAFASCNTVSNLIQLKEDADALISRAWRPLRSVLQLNDVSDMRSICFIHILCFFTIRYCVKTHYIITIRSLTVHYIGCFSVDCFLLFIIDKQSLYRMHPYA